MYEFITYQVKDFMTLDPIMVFDHVTLSDVDAIFEEHDVNGLPVVDWNQRLMGMITKLDLIRAFDFTKKSKVPHYETIMAQKIQEVMTKELNVVNPETPLTRVLHQMIETGHKSFPVVENDRVVGIVAREDIIRALRQAVAGQLPARLVSSSMEGLSEVSYV